MDWKADSTIWIAFLRQASVGILTSMKEMDGCNNHRIRTYCSRPAWKWELLTMLAGALAGRIAIDGRICPFALAYVTAAAIAGLNVIYALLGVLLGSLLLSGRPHLEPACASLLFYGMHLVLSRVRPRAEPQERIFLMCTASALCLLIFHRDGAEGLKIGLMTGGICVLGTLLMQSALRTLQQIQKRHILTDGEQIAISASFGILLMSVGDINAFGFSLPVMLLLLFSMIAALTRGIGGVAVSVALASALTVGGEFTLAFVGGLAACTLSGAALRRMDTIGVLGGFTGCSLLVGTYVFTASHTINLINLGAAGVVFFVVPKEWMVRICAYLDAEQNRERFARETMWRLRTRTAQDLRKTASVCREVAELFRPAPLEKEPTDALKQWAAQAAYGICADCPMRIYCWQDSRAAAEAIFSILQDQERGERLRIKKPFVADCKHMAQLASAAWQAQNQYLVQRAMQVETRQQYAFIHRQISGICRVLEQVSCRVEEDRWLDGNLEKRLTEGLEKRGFPVLGADVSYPDGRMKIHLNIPVGLLKRTREILEEAGHALKRELRLLSTETDGKTLTLILEDRAPLEAVCGIAGEAIAKNRISGDSTGERHLENGKVLYALSDGMGMGEKAKLESQSAIRMLFDLYSIGLDRDIALAGVNKLLLKQKADMYATLDAVSIDLKSGNAEFIKYGAPPTFILRNGRVHQVDSEALPAGIVPDAVPAISTATLRKRDAVVLFSDGALDALGEDTKAAICESLEGSMDPAMAANRLLRRAREKGQEDDMTVMVIKIA